MSAARVSELIVHALAALGVLFWIVMVVLTAIGDFEASLFAVCLLAIVLGGAHLGVSLATRRRSMVAIWLTWFILVADLLLGLLVNPKAFFLAGASVVLLLAGLRLRRLSA